MTVMMLRNSERSSFKTCRWRWSWTWHGGLQAREAPYALRFGDLQHQALAAYYLPGRKRGPHPAKTYQRLYREQAKKLADEGFDIYSDEKWIDALDLGTGMLEGYVRRFAAVDQEFEVISSEQVFQRRIRALRPPEAPASYPPVIVFTIVGTLDGVWRHIKSGRIVFKEFKTATTISEDGLSMDEQPSLYWTYAPRWLRRKGILRPDDADPREILYTFLRKAVPNDSKAKDAEGRVLNKPSKEALLAEFERLGRIPKCGKIKPRGGIDAKVDDMIAELGPDSLQLGEVAKVQPADYFHRTPVYRDASERSRLHERVVQEAFEIHEARYSRLSIFKNPGPLHMPNCRGCAVREACEVHEAGGDFQSVLNASTVPWNPYAAHELPERM